jgi:RNA-directed DNA polymerase
MTKQSLRSLFDAMYHGKFDFDDFRFCSMKGAYDSVCQGSIEGRRIFKPIQKLKVYHSFLNLFVFEHLPLNERVVFSYRKGFSAFNAVEKHRYSKYFFQTDISSFFDSIDSTLVRTTLLNGISTIPVADLEIYIDRILELVCVDDALPIGFPASAPLSNAVLYEFDKSLEKYCIDRDLCYTRYADDIIVSGKSKDVLANIDNETQCFLDKTTSKRLRLNLKKTKFYQVGNKVKILGMMILPNGKITPDTKKKKELEVLLHFYLSNKVKFANLLVGEEQDELDKIGGNLNYVNSIDPDYTNKLRRKFGATTIDTLLHRGSSKKS